MAGKPSYAELEKRVRELEDRCSLLSVNMDSFFVEAPAGLALFDRECRYVRINQTLAEVSRKELFLRLLFKNLPEKIFVKDADSRYLYCNNKFARNLGITPEEIAGKRDEDFFPAGFAEKCRAGDRRIMTSGKTEEIEEGYLVGGEERIVRMVKAPVVSGQGESVGLVGIFHDITERKQAETALAQYQAELERLIAERTAELQSTNTMLLMEIARSQELQEKLSRSERRYREVVEGTEDLITQMDSQGRLLFVNHASRKIYGLASEECLGLSAFSFVHPQDRAETQQAFQNCLEERREFVVWSNRHLGRNGETRFLHWTCNFHYDASGALLHVNGIARDMTELQKVQDALRQAYDEQEQRIAEQTMELEDKVAELLEAFAKLKETEAELRESEERFRQIAENIHSVFWIRSLPDNQLLYASPAYEKIWGRTCESLYLNPDSWLEAVHPEDRAGVLAGHSSRKNREQGVEFRIIRVDGSICWVRAKVFMLLCDRTGRKYREVGVAVDITSYKEIHDRLRESESRYRTFFETSIDGITICAGKKLVDCNESFMRLSGYDKVELLDFTDIRTIMNFINKQTGAASHRLSPDIFCDDGSCAGLYSLVRRDGQTSFIECRGNRLTIDGLEFMQCVHRDITQVKLAEEKVRHLSRRIIESTEEEQKRIARDLHDEFGQRLLTLRHKVDTLQKKLITAGKPDLPELAEIDGLINTIGSVVRSTTNRLRPELLDNLGFLPTLKWGMRDFAERYPLIQTSMEIVGAEKKIRPEYEIALYRVFQEGLTNIARHAEAKTVTARLIFSYPSLILTLADDGLGFDPEPQSGFPLKIRGGLGLRSMQERMLAIGGTLVLRSRRGEGTMLRAEVRQPTVEQEAFPFFMMNGQMRSYNP